MARKISVLIQDLICAVCLIVIWVLIAPSGAAANVVRDKCGELRAESFSTLQDAPTQITETKLILGGEGESAYCRVSGYVWPQVGFELRLPVDAWNGKLIEIGCGGFCGATAWTFWCPFHRGYACVVSDMGHRSSGDGLWAFNNLQAQTDWSYRGLHVVALAAKGIVERFYGNRARKSYYFGCSTGGHQGMMEAQRFPWDFDGIIAGAPDYELSGVEMQGLWSGQAIVRASLTSSDLDLVHRAALETCDLDDGVKDGIISNPRACTFNLDKLACDRGRVSGCLTREKITAVKEVYTGPVTSAGAKLYGGPEPGSERNWIDGQLEPYVKDGRIPPDNMIGDLVRYLGFDPAPGPSWTVSDFDFDRDDKRFVMFEALHAASNPDLRKFKAAGGKLLVFHGWEDMGNLPADSVDYYETVERTMGGRARTQDFFRLFMVPGMQHCTGGEGAFAIDYLTYMENWAERGEAPDKLVGAHIDQSYLQRMATEYGKQHGVEDDGKLHDIGGAFLMVPRMPLDPAIPVTFTRPIFPYPLYAKYVGRGDSNKAENFKPVQP